MTGCRGPRGGTPARTPTTGASWGRWRPGWMWRRSAGVRPGRPPGGCSTGCGCGRRRRRPRRSPAATRSWSNAASVLMVPTSAGTATPAVRSGSTRSRCTGPGSCPTRTSASSAPSAPANRRLIKTMAMRLLAFGVRFVVPADTKGEMVAVGPGGRRHRRLPRPRHGHRPQPPVRAAETGPDARHDLCGADGAATAAAAHRVGRDRVRPGADRQGGDRHPTSPRPAHPAGRSHRLGPDAAAEPGRARRPAAEPHPGDGRHRSRSRCRC